MKRETLVGIMSMLANPMRWCNQPVELRAAEILAARWAIDAAVS
jgi:hypothetical protein